LNQPAKSGRQGSFGEKSRKINPLLFKTLLLMKNVHFFPTFGGFGLKNKGGSMKSESNFWGH
jgi:hypothetical protein